MRKICFYSSNSMIISQNNNHRTTRCRSPSLRRDSIIVTHIDRNEYSVVYQSSACFRPGIQLFMIDLIVRMLRIIRFVLIALCIGLYLSSPHKKVMFIIIIIAQQLYSIFNLTSYIHFNTLIFVVLKTLSSNKNIMNYY